MTGPEEELDRLRIEIGAREFPFAEGLYVSVTKLLEQPFLDHLTDELDLFHHTPEEMRAAVSQALDRAGL